MPALVAAEGASALAHGIHYALVAAGLAGLGALLFPTLAAGSRRSPSTLPPDPHERRVDQLRSAVDRYAHGGTVTDLLAAQAPTVSAAAPPAGSRLLLPVAVTSCAGAAGIHAAMFPEHLRESALFGAFFLGCTLVQLTWCGLVLHRPTADRVLAGAVGNVAVVALWAVTRTLGLPFGLLPGPEEVGPWDVTCAAWELVSAGACVLVLHRSAVRRVARWSDWRPGAHAWFALTAAAFGFLSMTGMGG